MFTTIDTIVAIATPPGRGGLGVVRLSGTAAAEIATGLLGRERPLRPRYATLGTIREQSGEAVDEVVATWFQAPRSYTREDVVELAAHGSPVLLRRIVDLAIARGARLAEPGEFTLRAYLNGRLDLVQAEAVADLVDAVTPLQARIAMDQLEGTLTERIAGVESALFDLAARLEASLDFPDEGFHFITTAEIDRGLSEVRDSLAELARDGRTGRLLREGGLVAIVGRPNAGKSSLFNALVGASRAIVAETPGTTRDLITERIDVEGLPVTLIDTAGLRESDDLVESEGIRRAREAQTVAALTLLVVDRSQALADGDRLWFEREGGRTIVVFNKCDLDRAWPEDDLPAAADRGVNVSARTGEGIEALRKKIVRALTANDDWRDPPAISNMRHLGHVNDAIATLEHVREIARSGGTEELLLAELASARRSLEEITGRKSPDALLNHVFARFCVGK